MLRLGLIALLAMLASVAQAAPNLLPSAGAGGPPGGAVAYTGPGDVVSGATAFWGLRAYTQAIANAGTQKLANIRRASDGDSADFLVVSNGGVGLSANCSGGAGCNGLSLSSFLNATTGSVTKLYDQSGNGNDISQATVANQPGVVLNCLGSLPCMSFNGTSQGLHASLTTVNQPFSATSVSDFTGACSSSCEMIATYDGSTGSTLELTNSTTVAAWTGNTVTATTTQSAWHNYSAVYNGAANGALAVDATQATGQNIGSQSTGAEIDLGFLQNGASRFFAGDIAEAGLWAVAFSTTQQTNLCHNEYTYWGTSTSC